MSQIRAYNFYYMYIVVQFFSSVCDNFQTSLIFVPLRCSNYTVIMGLRQRKIKINLI